MLVSTTTTKRLWLPSERHFTGLFHAYLGNEAGYVALRVAVGITSRSVGRCFGKSFLDPASGVASKRLTKEVAHIATLFPSNSLSLSGEVWREADRVGLRDPGRSDHENTLRRKTIWSPVQTQPVLRRPALMPLMVAEMARSSSAAAFGSYWGEPGGVARLRRMSSTWMSDMGST